MSNNAADLREKQSEELLRDIAEMERKIWDLRFQRGSEKADDPSKIRNLRRAVARQKTIIRERELGLARGGKS